MTEATPTPTARIKRIEVVGLFGLYDHVIDLNLEDRVTILHGPNGVGKTILLQMIRALLTDQIGELAQVPFQEFSVVFTDASFVRITVTVEKTLPHADMRGRVRERKEMAISRGDQSSTLEFERRQSSPASAAFTQAGMDAAFIQRHSKQFQGDYWLGNDTWKLTDKSVPVHFIETQRISRRPKLDGESHESTHLLGFPAVWSDAIDLERTIASLLRAYGAIAQDLDQSFPTRLLRRTGHSLPPQELKHRMAAVEALRAALRSNGILDESGATPFNIAELDSLSPAQSDVMALYVEDNEKKLGVFADFLHRIELLLRILNSRFRNKSIRADHRLGFVVLDHRSNPLELRALSSGEQQQIIVLYDLLFRTRRNTFVLLDEPELSWHILWQERFLPDLLEIVKVASVDALIATHSPFIVGDRSDLMVPLDAEIDHDKPLQV